MPIGWIDFSKSERNKVIGVLDLLSESATLDELGIAPIRDGFANLFFPGTSTIQTRAKYFFIVPYAIRDLELGGQYMPNAFQSALNARERACCQKLVEIEGSADGIIGRRTLSSSNWVKRTPADVYWAGLRQYGIFLGGNYSLSEYIRAVCNLKMQKGTLKNLGNRNDSAGDDDKDDTNAGDVRGYRFWNMPLYQKEWFQTLQLDLTQEEGAFLKEQILRTCPNSLMALILRENLSETLEVKNFRGLGSVIDRMPEQMQENYRLAVQFSDFIYALRTVYNVITSNGKLESAMEELERQQPIFSRLADLDIDYIMQRLSVYNPGLRTFLLQAKQHMKHGDLEPLKQCIKAREVNLKGQSRAKTCHPDQYGDFWLGGGELDYRFFNARTIMRDIFNSEVKGNAKS